MDQCLEAVRYNHMEKCGTTTLARDVEDTVTSLSGDSEGSGEGSGAGDSAGVDPSQFLLAELSEEELVLIYAELFNHVSLSLNTLVN